MLLRWVLLLLLLLWRRFCAFRSLCVLHLGAYVAGAEIIIFPRRDGHFRQVRELGVRNVLLRGRGRGVRKDDHGGNCCRWPSRGGGCRSPGEGGRRGLFNVQSSTAERKETQLDLENRVYSGKKAKKKRKCKDKESVSRIVTHPSDVGRLLLRLAWPLFPAFFLVLLGGGAVAPLPARFLVSTGAATATGGTSRTCSPGSTEADGKGYA